MNIKAVITMLVLGSSSAAMASPSVSFSGRAQAHFSFGTNVRTRPVIVRQPAFRDHRTVAVQPVYTAPSYINDYSTYDRYDGRFDDGGYPVYQPVPQPVIQPTQWTELASEISFMQRSAKMPSDQAVVHVGGDLELIRIEGEYGQSAIRQVYVAFSDGSAKTIDVNKVLRPGETITVDIGRRANVKAMRLFSGITGRGEILTGTFTVSGA